MTTKFIKLKANDSVPILVLRELINHICERDIRGITILEVPFPYVVVRDFVKLVPDKLNKFRYEYDPKILVDMCIFMKLKPIARQYLVEDFVPESPVKNVYLRDKYYNPDHPLFNPISLEDIKALLPDKQYPQPVKR